MEFQTAYASGGAFGTWVIMDHNEARHLTSGLPSGTIAQALAGMGFKWAPPAAKALTIQSKYIRKEIGKSPGQGIELLFIWKVHAFGDIKRTGSAYSLCGRMRQGAASRPTTGVR